MSRLATFFGSLLLMPIIGAQTPPEILGTITSSAPITINGAQMTPSAASFWPVAAGDEIASTRTAALLTLNNRSQVRLDPGSKVSLKTVNDGQPYLYSTQGVLSFETPNKVLFCVSGALFIPGVGARGFLRPVKPLVVGRHLYEGVFEEAGRRACDMRGPLGVLPSTAGVAGATAATGLSTSSGMVVVGGVWAGLTAQASDLNTSIPPSVSPSAP